MSVYWADVSQYQDVPIDDSYPHRVFSFRTNSGDKVDTLAHQNGRRALAMLDAGKLDVVIPYYFFRPGQANCDLHREVLKSAGLWGHPRIVTMVDVEDAGQYFNDVSAEVNDEIARLGGWYGDPRRVIGYYNPNPAPNLWPRRPADLKLVVPHYGRQPGDSYDFPGRFAHQYSDRVVCAPFGACDANFTGMDMPELLAMLGIEGGGTVGVPEDVQQQLRGPELAGWDQLGGRTLVDAVAVILTQLIGPNPFAFDGWPQIGNRTFVDGVAQLLTNQVRISERLDLIAKQNAQILAWIEGEQA